MALSEQELRSEISRLGPWHLNIEITPEVSTAAFLEGERQYDPSFGTVSFLPQARENYVSLISKIYPDGFAGRSMLDCACNSGGYCFWSRELGASRCFGFDVREHWIEQARFVQQHRQAASDQIDFKVCDLYELPKLGLEPFDFTLFKGIFYHLAEPVGGLKIAADLTKDVIVVNTGTRNNMPDGMLFATSEDPAMLMSGVDDLIWYPTGPGVLKQMLSWMGFKDFHMHWWLQDGDFGRMEIFAARDQGRFDHLRPKP